MHYMSFVGHLLEIFCYLQYIYTIYIYIYDMYHLVSWDVAFVAVTGRLNLSVAFYDISLILRSVAAIFRQ